MVLILLSSPNPMTPLLQSPRSKEFSQLSPRTPATPSPSFFAILSPIFTADDSAPQSPTPRQLSPGTIPPETPPPWLLAPQSPASPLRPTPIRQPSTDSKRQFSLPRLTTGEGLANSPRSLSRPQRPGLPSITHSFTSGSPQPFRPPPPGSIKRMNTAPVLCKQPSSPLSRSWRAASEPSKAQQDGMAPRKPQPQLTSTVTSSSLVPALQVRPPSRELEEGKPESSSEGEDSLGDEEARRLSVAVMGVDIGSEFEGNTSSSSNSTASSDDLSETMEVPIAIDLDPSTTASSTPALKPSAARPATPASLIKPIPRSVTELRGPGGHSRSQSLDAGNITGLTPSAQKARPKPIATQMARPLQLNVSRSPRLEVDREREVKKAQRSMSSTSMSVGSGGLGPLGKLAIAAAGQS